MRRCWLLIAIVFTFLPTAVWAANGHQALRAPLQRLIDSYLKSRREPEHIAAISLSVSFANEPANLNLVTGRMSRSAASPPITPHTLFQIGSITKSFTAAAILQLEAERKLSINQTLGDLLPQYPAWRNVSLRRLLNMTSGIPGYDNSRAMQAAMATTLDRRWEPAQIIAFADPVYGHAMKPTRGYDYSNTNYLLAGLIVERAAGHTYGEEISHRFFGSALGLENTYFSPHRYPRSVTDRMLAGYFWSTSDGNALLKNLLGLDVRTSDMSWAGAAGGIVATPEDVTHWVRALFQGSVLAPEQRREMESVVSLKSGRPIARATAKDPAGFGLGVVQAIKPGLGTFWFYQGETLGYRMLYGYFPRDNLIVAVGADSQPEGSQNRIGQLLENVYKEIHRHPASN